MARKRARKQQRVISPTEDSMPMLLPNLPMELIDEILLRLPVKSLLRFKCVCKSWNTLISDPQFAKRHLYMSTTTCLDYTRIRLVKCSESKTSLKCCTADSVLREQTPREFELDYPMKARNSYVRVLDLCDGLLFVRVGDKFFVWNPCTREHEVLPIEFSRRTYCAHGFGHDESSDDYKIVLFSHSQLTLPQVQVRVFSLRTNSWKRIGGFSFGVPLEQPCEELNGALLWQVYHFDGGKKLWRLVSFDLAKETFQEIPLPDYGNADIELVTSVWKGCLCVIYEGAGHCPDVWIMKEYGVKESWTKLVSVPYEPKNSDENSRTILSKLDNGGVLMKHCGVLVMGTPKASTIVRSVFGYFHEGTDGTLFFESLISPGAVSGRRHYNLRKRKMRYVNKRNLRLAST